MPRPTRRTKKQATIGIFGLGEAGPKTIAPLLDKFLDGLEATFVVPITKAHTTDSVQAVLDYAAEKDIPFHAVIDDSVAKSRTLKSLLKDADGETKATDIGTSIVNQLKDAEDGRLVVLWDDELGEGEDGGAYDAVEYAEEHDIPSYNLCKALQVIDFGEDGAAAEGDEEEKAPEPEPEEEKPRARRRKAEEAEAEDSPLPDADHPNVVVVDDRDEARADLPPYREAAKLGIRQLRTLARDRELANSRQIGSMDHDAVLELLYPHGDLAPHQTTLEEQIASAEHTVASNGAVTNGVAPVPAGAISINDLVEMIAVSVADRVKELVDA